MLSKIMVSPSPHISRAQSTRNIMLDVIIGLLPAVAAAWWFFRTQAMIIVGTCVVTCVITEWLCNIIRRKPNSLGDLSAVVTGIILALSLPSAIPFWAAIIGSAFAIAIAKMVFGGLGSNIFNPAMAARAFLAACFGMLMTTWAVPATIGSSYTTLSAMSDSPITQATPLAWSKEAIKEKAKADVSNNMLKASCIGEVGGCLGETSAIALLIGGVYLLIRKTITLHIPFAVLVSAFASLISAGSPSTWKSAAAVSIPPAG